MRKRSPWRRTHTQRRLERHPGAPRSRHLISMAKEAPIPAAALCLGLLWLLILPGPAARGQGLRPGLVPANPDSVTIRFEPVDNTSGGAALDGFVTTDIRLDFEDQLTGSELIIDLDTGSFYRDPVGNADGLRPGPFFEQFPSLEFDTAIWGGFPGSGAVDLGGGFSPICLLYTSPSPRDLSTSRMPSSA